MRQRLSSACLTVRDLRKRPGKRQARVEQIEARTLLSSPYHLTYDDEFNTMPQIAQTRGSATPGYLPTDYWNNHYLSGNAEQEYYVFPGLDTGYNPFSVSNGVLTITANPTPVGMNTGGQPYVSGELTTSRGANYSVDIQSSTPFSQQYGYFEMRAKLPSGKGLWPAFWLMPSNGGSAAEYDIFEVLGHDTSSIYQTAHWSNYTGHQGYNYQNHINSADGFHIYGFEWDASNIRWYVDGVLTQTQVNHSNTPMYILMNLAVGGSWPGNPDGTTPWPANMDIDYLRVYSADPSVPTVQPQAGYDGTLPGAIDTPSLPLASALAVNPGTISLSWNAINGATSYNIYRSTTPGGEGSTPYQTDVTGTSFAETGLLGLTTFYYTVEALNIIGASGQSAEVYATTPAVPASLPLDFSDVTVSDYSLLTSGYQPSSLVGSGVTIAWSGVTRYGTNTWDGYIDHTKSLNSSAPSIDIGTRSASGQWSTSMYMDFSQAVTVPSIWVTSWDWWKQGVTLKGYTNAGDSTPAVTVILTDANIPSHPTGNPSGASWVNVTGLAGVQIQRLEVIGTKLNSTSQIGQALVDDITIMPAGRPDQVTGLSATPGTGQIDLTWNALTEATSYNIYRSTTSGGEGITPYRSGITATSFADTGLSAGTTYYYKVAAVNSFGTGNFSSEAYATTVTPLNFSNLTTGDYGSVPQTYQPLPNVTITWSGVTRYGTHTWDGYIDHTKSLDAAAPSIDIGTRGGSGQWSTSMYMDFNQSVTIPSIWVTSWDWWKQGVTLKGYTETTDTDPVVTVTLTDANIPSHPTGNPSGASWVNVTDLAAVPIRRLEVIGTKLNSTSQYGLALVDDITIVPVSPLRLAGPVVTDSDAGSLTRGQLLPIFAEAKWLWKRSGVDSAAFSHIDVRIADLPGDLLGENYGSTIVMDINAAGYGWWTGRLEPPPTKLDLLTAVSHELGHVLGLHHSDGEGQPVMLDTLPAGVRRLPQAIASPFSTSRIGADTDGVEELDDLLLLTSYKLS